MTDARETNRIRERSAIGMLLVACAFWGMSFNWNKEAQEILSLNWVAVGHVESLEAHGPATFLAIRFPLAALAWAMLFPRSLHGWTTATIRGGAFGGLFLSIGMLLQHYGLAYTSESLSAFLTSLTILFTPIAAALLLKHRVPPALWFAIGLATLGVALMTLHREEGRFDIGALLGLLCAVVFSGHLLVVDYFGKREDPWRFTLAQLIVAAMVFVGYAIWRSGGDVTLAPGVVMRAFESGKFAALTLAAVFFATLVTFGIMFRFQPRTTPTRAALVYLTEPLFATAYAWFAADRIIGPVAWLGAGLIILGNVVAEVFARREAPSDSPVAPPATSSDS